MNTFRVSLAYSVGVFVDCETNDLEKVLKKAVVALEKAASDVLYEIEEIEHRPAGATLETLNTITRIRYGFESVDLCYIERWENLPRPCKELLKNWLDPWDIDAELREELFPETI